MWLEVTLRTPPVWNTAQTSAGWCRSEAANSFSEAPRVSSLGVTAKCSLYQ